jgi:hypothetical protein
MNLMTACFRAETSSYATKQCFEDFVLGCDAASLGNRLSVTRRHIPKESNP